MLILPVGSGVHDLINVISSGGPMISSGRMAQETVEVLSGFILSAHGGNVNVQLPIPRTATAEEPAERADLARLASQYC